MSDVNNTAYNDFMNKYSVSYAYPIASASSAKAVSPVFTNIGGNTTSNALNTTSNALNTTSNALNTTSNALNTTSKGGGFLSSIGNFIKATPWLGVANIGTQAIGLGFNIYSTIKAQRTADDQLSEMKKQLAEENRRWENREEERKQAAEAVKESAKYLTSPLPTQRD